jgi:hypothetical protein
MTPESERHKDVWDLYAFGHSGHLVFTGITQPWLREAAKQWAYNDLPKRRGRAAGGVTRTHINGVARLSESLRLQRADLGDNVTALGREDVTAFLNRMAFVHDQGKISAHTRLRQCREVRLVLAGMRSLGLREPGKSLHRLPDGFTLTGDDMPDEPEESEAGKGPALGGDAVSLRPPGHTGGTDFQRISCRGRVDDRHRAASS